jgi:excisionase family DNA binding protein
MPEFGLNVNGNVWNRTLLCYRGTMPDEWPPDERLMSIEEAARRVGKDRRTLDRWIARGLLRPYKKPRDRHTLIDLAELPEAMRRAGRPGPRPRRER